MNDIYYYIDVRFINGDIKEVRFPDIQQAVSYAKTLNFDNLDYCILTQRVTLFDEFGDASYHQTEDTNAVDFNFATTEDGCDCKSLT